MTRPDRSRLRVDGGARERLLDALYRLTADREPEDPVVAAAEPLVAFCKGWRPVPALDEWLTALAETPDVLVLRIRAGEDDPIDDRPTETGRSEGEAGRADAYVRNRDGWLVVRSKDGRVERAHRVDREVVATLAAGSVVEPDVVDELPVAVRSRFVDLN